MVKNKIFACIWRFLGLFVALFGIVSNYVVTATSGEGVWMLGCYFTIQTNIFVAILFAVLAIKSVLQLKNKQTDLKQQQVANTNISIQTAVTFFITITFLVYWTMLSNLKIAKEDASPAIMALSKVSNVVVHGLTPLWAIADWVMFCPHGKLKYKDALIWDAYPLAYGVFCIIRAQIGGPFYVLNDITFYYPYPFLEPQHLATLPLCQNGLNPFVLMAFVCAAMLAAYWALGCLFVLLDKFIAKKTVLKS